MRKFIFDPLMMLSLDLPSCALPPQARTLLRIVLASGRVELGETDLETLFRNKAAELRTRQASWKVFRRHKARLKSEGYLREEKS